MTDKGDKNLVPVFNGTGFTQWRHRMANRLLEKDLDEVVGFDTVTLAPNSVAPALTAATKGTDTDDSLSVRRDRKAKAAIEHRVDAVVLTIISKCSTSHETWKALHSAYHRKTMAAVVTALKALVSTIKGRDEAMQTFIARIQANCQALIDTGITWDLLAVGMLMANVGEEYGSTISALDTLDSVSISKATTMLLNAEQTISEQSNLPLVTSAHARELNSLKAQIAALTVTSSNTSRVIRKKFSGIPCSTHFGRMLYFVS